METFIFTSCLLHQQTHCTMTALSLHSFFFCNSPFILSFFLFPPSRGKSPFPLQAMSWQYLEVIVILLSAAVRLTCLHYGSAGCIEWAVGGWRLG